MKCAFESWKNGCYKEEKIWEGCDATYIEPNFFLQLLNLQPENMAVSGKIYSKLSIFWIRDF